MKRLSLFLFCSLLTVHCSCLPAGTALALEIPRFYGQEIIVTAARIPQLKTETPWEVSIITEEDIKNQGAKTVADALRSVAGVDIKSNGYLGAINSAMIRGASSQQTLVLIDGRKINSPLLGTVDLGDVLVENVERIEVVKAPLSALYGADAVGGVINIITKKPSEKPQLEADVSVGSFATQLYKVKLGGSGKLNYLLTASLNRSDGFRKNSDYDSQNYNAAISWGDLGINMNLYKAQRGVPGVPTPESDPTSASTPDERQRDENGAIEFRYKDFKVFQNQGDQFFHYQFGLDDRYRYWIRGIAFQQNKNYFTNSFSYGLDYQQSQVESSLAGDQKTDNTALYLQDILNVGKHSVTLGVRGDSHSVYGGVVNPRIGALFRLPAEMAIRASYGTAFKAPTFNDLFSSWGGDRNIKPERSQSYDLGVEKQWGDLTSAKISFYHNDVENLIQWLPPTWTAANIGSVSLRGLEFELSKKAEDFNGYLNYTWQDARDGTAVNKDKFLIYRPQNKLCVGLGGRPAGIQSNLNIRYIGERYADQANTVILASYTTVDLRVGRTIGQGDLYLLAENLLDEKYFESYDNMTGRFYPQPGRRYTLGVKWEK